MLVVLRGTTCWTRCLLPIAPYLHGFHSAGIPITVKCGKNCSYQYRIRTQGVVYFCHAGYRVAVGDCCCRFYCNGLMAGSCAGSRLDTIGHSTHSLYMWYPALLADQDYPSYHRLDS